MPPHTPITVVLAHFDDLLARGLRELIESDPSLAIVAADVEHRRISVVLRAHRPDVAILDVGALGQAGRGPRAQRLPSGHSTGPARERPRAGRVCAAARVRSERLPRQGHPVARRDQRDPPRLARASGDSRVPIQHGRRIDRERKPADPARGRRASAAPAGSLERSDSSRPAGGRRDSPHACTQHLPQARRRLPPRARRAATRRSRHRAWLIRALAAAPGLDIPAATTTRT